MNTISPLKSYVYVRWTQLHPFRRLDSSFWQKVLEAMAVENISEGETGRINDLIKRVQETYGNDVPIGNSLLVKEKLSLEKLLVKVEEKRKEIKVLEKRGW